MLYGVDKEKLQLDDVFYVLDFVFNSLTTPQAESFWHAIESRGEDLSRNLIPNGLPGIFLVKILKSLTERLNPFVYADFRAKVEQFYFHAFGPSSADPSANDEKVPLLITQEESSSHDFKVLLAVEKGLADIKSTAESADSLRDFLDNVQQLDDIFIRRQDNHRHMLKGSYSELILSPELIDFQARDCSFQCKISMQILLFIEALLILRPSEIETFTAQRKSKLVWGKVVLDEDLASAVKSAKRVWFGRFKSQATPDQLEALRLIITREKEALAFSLLTEKPEIAKDTEVNLDADYTPKLRSKHFHDMGNQKLSSLWNQSLGPEAFIASNDKQRESARSMYEKSKSAPSENNREADRWMALFMQRNTDWPMLNDGEPPAVGPIFGQPATPMSPSRESEGEKDDSKDVTPNVTQSPLPKSRPDDDGVKHDESGSTNGDSRGTPIKRNDDRSNDEVPSPKRPRISRESPV